MVLRYRPYVDPQEDKEDGRKDGEADEDSQAAVLPPGRRGTIVPAQLTKDQAEATYQERYYRWLQAILPLEPRHDTTAGGTGSSTAQLQNATNIPSGT